MSTSTYICIYIHMSSIFAGIFACTYACMYISYQRNTPSLLTHCPPEAYQLYTCKSEYHRQCLSFYCVTAIPLLRLFFFCNSNTVSASLYIYTINRVTSVSLSLSLSHALSLSFSLVLSSLLSLSLSLSPSLPPSFSLSLALSLSLSPSPHLETLSFVSS
jgi:hypothetical protein